MSNEKQIYSEKGLDGSTSDIKHIDVAQNVNARLANPLEGIPHDQLMKDASTFAHAHGLGEHDELFQKGALVAQDPSAFESLPQLTEEDKNIFRREITHRWDQPAQLYYLVIMCSMAAAVQGVCIFLRLISFLGICG